MLLPRNISHISRNMKNLKKHVFPQWKTITCPFLIHGILVEIQRYCVESEVPSTGWDQELLYR